MTIAAVDRFDALIADASAEEVAALTVRLVSIAPTRRVRYECPVCHQWLGDDQAPACFPRRMMWTRRYCGRCGKARFYDLHDGAPADDRA